MILPKLYLPLDHDHSRISWITVYTALYSSDMIIADITYFFEPKGHSRTFFEKVADIFVYDNKRTISRWPWKFEPLGQMGSKGHLERE